MIAASIQQQLLQKKIKKQKQNKLESFLHSFLFHCHSKYHLYLYYKATVTLKRTINQILYVPGVLEDTKKNIKLLLLIINKVQSYLI